MSAVSNALLLYKSTLGRWVKASIWSAFYKGSSPCIEHCFKIVGEYLNLRGRYWRES